MSWGSWREYRRYPSRDATYMIRLYERFDHEGKRHTKNDKIKLEPNEIAYVQRSGPQEEQVSPNSECDPLKGVL